MTSSSPSPSPTSTSITSVQDHLLSFLDSFHASPTSTTSASASTNQVYDQFADTPTRKKNQILRKRSQTLDALKQLANANANATAGKPQAHANAHDAKFVSFLVEILSEGVNSTNGPNLDSFDHTDAADGSFDAQVENNDPMERLDGMLHLISLLGSGSGASSFESSMLVPFMMRAYGEDGLKTLFSNMTLDKLCNLPSSLLAMEMEMKSSDTIKNSNAKRRKMNSSHSIANNFSAAPISITAASLKRVYVILGYVMTHVILQETFDVVQFREFGQYVQEKMTMSGFVSKRMYSVEHDAFQVGFVAYMLDCMMRSTDVWEGGLDPELELDHEQSGVEGAVRNCWVRNDLWIEGLRVQAVVDCLFDNW